MRTWPGPTRLHWSSPAMRESFEFSGAGLIEGALSVDSDRIRQVQRGNAEPCDGLDPIDATADFSWTALCDYLSDPARDAPPALSNIRTEILASWLVCA